MKRKNWTNTDAQGLSDAHDTGRKEMYRESFADVTRPPMASRGVQSAGSLSGWFGFSSLSRSSNQINQLPATRREMLECKTRYFFSWGRGPGMFVPGA
jgi:hypothetical protein